MTFDSANGNYFIVNLDGGKKVLFEQSPEGLHYHTTEANPDLTAFLQLVGANAMKFVDTVAENMEGFSQRQLKGAEMASDG